MFYRLKFHSPSRTAHALIIACVGVQWIVLDWQFALLAAGFVAAFYLFIYGWLGWIVVRPLLFLGTISYGLYLTHQNIGYAVMRQMYRFGLPSWLVILSTLVLALALASVLALAVELPCRRRIRQWYARFQAMPREHRYQEQRGGVYGASHRP